MSTETVGERIRAARERKGITQSALADAVGVRQPTMWRYEARGMTPSAETAIAIARVLDVSAHWLLHGTEAEPTQPTDLPDLPYWREFLEKYEHAAELTDDDLRAMRAFAGRTHRIRSWTDWERLAEWSRTTKIVAPARQVAAPKVEEDDDDPSDDRPDPYEGNGIDPYAGSIDPYPPRKRR